MDAPMEQQQQQRPLRTDVACQTDSLELDEATLRNELAMAAYLEILGVLDDDKQPVYHDLGEAYANKVFLQAMAAADDVDEEPMEEEAAADAGAAAVAVAAGAADAEPAGAAAAAAAGSGPQLVRLQSLESQVIDAEWSIRCKLAQVRESAKHPVQRWLEGALPNTASASPFASRAPSVRSHQLQHLPHQHLHQHSSAATLSHCSRPSSVAALSEVFVSDSDDEDDDDEEDADDAASKDAAEQATTPTPGGLAAKSEMTFYDCAVHGVEVPESFVRIKLRVGGGAAGGGGGGEGDSEEKDPPRGPQASGLHADN